MTSFKKSGFIALSLVTLLAASPLMAQSSFEGQATLNNAPTRALAIIDGALWSCSGQTCQATTVSGSVPASIACKKFVVAFGAVSAFTYGGKTLSAEKLAVCNQAAKN
jgi:hypothetical protein